MTLQNNQYNWIGELCAMSLWCPWKIFSNGSQIIQIGWLNGEQMKMNRLQWSTKSLSPFPYAYLLTLTGRLDTGSSQKSGHAVTRHTSLSKWLESDSGWDDCWVPYLVSMIFRPWTRRPLLAVIIVPRRYGISPYWMNGLQKLNINFMLTAILVLFIG